MFNASWSVTLQRVVLDNYPFLLLSVSLLFSYSIWAFSRATEMDAAVILYFFNSKYCSDLRFHRRLRCPFTVYPRACWYFNSTKRWRPVFRILPFISWLNHGHHPLLLILVQCARDLANVFINRYIMNLFSWCDSNPSRMSNNTLPVSRNDTLLLGELLHFFKTSVKFVKLVINQEA